MLSIQTEQVIDPCSSSAPSLALRDILRKVFCFVHWFQALWVWVTSLTLWCQCWKD